MLALHGGVVVKRLRPRRGAGGGPEARQRLLRWKLEALKWRRLRWRAKRECRCRRLHTWELELRRTKWRCSKSCCCQPRLLLLWLQRLLLLTTGLILRCAKHKVWAVGRCGCRAAAGAGGAAAAAAARLLLLLLCGVWLLRKHPHLGAPRHHPVR